MKKEGRGEGKKPIERQMSKKLRRKRAEGGKWEGSGRYEGVMYPGDSSGCYVYGYAIHMHEERALSNRINTHTQVSRREGEKTKAQKDTKRKVK